MALHHTEDSRALVGCPLAQSVTMSSDALVDPNGRTLAEAAEEDLRARQAELARLERHIANLKFSLMLISIFFYPFSLAVIFPPLPDMNLFAPWSLMFLICVLMWLVRQRLKAQRDLLSK